MFDDQQAYDAFMGRWSAPLAELFVRDCRIVPGMRVLDVGCGTGSLTAALLGGAGGADPAARVAGCDPSPNFVAAYRARHRGVEVRQGRAEALPFEDATFDAALAELVLHFLDDPDAGAAEMVRVVRPGGRVGACVWAVEDGMSMLRLFWDAATAESPDAPAEGRTLRFGRPGEVATLLTEHGLEQVEEHELSVTSTYADFEELWAGFLGGVGPAGSYLVSLGEERRALVREGLYDRLDSPRGSFTLEAVALSASGVVPSSARA